LFAALLGLLLLVPRERGCPGLSRVGLGQMQVEDAVLFFFFVCLGWVVGKGERRRR